jgi:hypothetical protein
MGRSLSFYIVPKDLPQHDSTKPMCLDLECEPENYEIDDLIYEKVHIADPQSSYSRYCPSSNRKHIDECATCYKFRYKGWEKESVEDWCATCHLYVNGLRDSPLVIHHKNVYHSYGNSIWGSDFNIKRLYLGDDSTDFARRFDRERMYREISAVDVDDAFAKLERLGACHRTSDKEAREETLEILEMLKRYKDDPTVRMVMEDEF